MKNSVEAFVRRIAREEIEKLHERLREESIQTVLEMKTGSQYILISESTETVEQLSRAIKEHFDLSDVRVIIATANDLKAYVIPTKKPG
jgi:phosphoribosyl-ATP pyrophosphohydrolase